MRFERHIPLVLFFVACGLMAPASAAEVDYLRDVKPVLKERCFACHGALKQQSGLRLDSAALIRQGGDSGAAVIPGDAANSPLLERIASRDDSIRMPPEGEPLSSEQIAHIGRWVMQGATGPEDERAETDPREHWAFREPRRPDVPMVAPAPGITNPIDVFLAARREEQGLTAQPAAGKRIWLRRVTLDLIGLPPTLEEQAAFLADDSPDACDKVVTRLLESPHYGERWGRHWMDIWRYSDWWGLGAEVRNSQKHIWHWRDWIIENLNQDTPYDEMLRQMLAADELYPNDLDRLRATGFLARQYFKFNRTSWLDETIEHTAKAMLGLTFNCAKCHDHKYDPFSQEDYYRLRAIFEPYQVRMEQTPGEVDYERDGIPRAFDCNLDLPTHLHLRGDDRNPDKSRTMAAALPALLGVKWQIDPVTLPLEAHQPGLRPFVLENYLEAAAAKIDQARKAVDAARQKLQAAAPDKTEQAKLEVTLAEKSLVAAETQPAKIRAQAAADRARFSQPPAGNSKELASAAAHAERTSAVAAAEESVARAELDVAKAAMDKKADAEKKLSAAREAAEKARQALNQPSESYTSLSGALKTLESNLEKEDSRRKPFPKSSTGRRTALARWITDRQNPLTARVAVNHVWSRHMGRPLVPTVFDFGRKGTPPTHPELLDWLAVELMEHGWSMKHVHRLIVLSGTYRITSSSAGVSVETMTRDPDDRYYWRATATRMEAQTVRDSLLYLAGELDPTLGGPSIPAANEKSKRRSLYFVHSHNEHNQFLATFDDAAVRECYRRSESIVPQQALALENSPLAASMAETIAERLASAQRDLAEDDFIRLAFQSVLAAEPTTAELTACHEALRAFQKSAGERKVKNPAQQARTNLIHALLNHNDFVTIR